MTNENWKLRNGKWILFSLLLLFAATFRIAVAHCLPNDSPGDGVVYAQMARNVLEQHVYSHDTQPPYNPSLVRLPGYPLFLATIYSIFGHTNNGAVRVVQALIDTGTCALIAVLAFMWQPDEKKKQLSAVAALALAAVCPFTTIYAATILTEVPTNFLVMAMFVAATLALKPELTKEKGRIIWWVIAGLLGGLSVFFRPDNGLFVAAVGLTLVISAVRRIFGRRITPSGSDEDSATVEPAKRIALQSHMARMVLYGLVFSLSFALLFVPWTIRNWRLFHVFQPLAPAHADMPGEFVPRGYQRWVRSWLDDDNYIAPFLWSVDTDPIDIDDVPPAAFDSAAEKARVEALLEKYNYPDGAPKPSPKPEATPTPNVNPKANSSPTNTNREPENSEEEEDGEESDDEAKEQHGPVEMTPEIDAGFAQIAAERIARHPFLYYVWLPLKRARAMWLDTHSQYWPFEGRLLPFEDLDYAGHQQYWLPLFAALTALYTLLGLTGAWFLWTSENFAARQWVILVGLAIVLRLILFSSMENPEPRYVVEFFPMLSILGGIAIARIKTTEPKHRGKT